MDFASVIDSLQRADNGYRVALPDTWKQGRTAYGGASAALALAASVAAFEELPPLRSAQFMFPGPLEGELAITPTLLRRGRSASFVRTEVSGNGVTGLSAAFLFAAPRGSHVAFEAPRRDLPPRGGPVVVPPQVLFAQNFEMAKAGDRPDGTLAGDAIGFERWVRLLERDRIDPLTELILLADSLPPAAMARFERHGPISTMSWQIDVLDLLPPSSDGWHLLSTTGRMARDGVSNQSMAIWDTQGRQVASGSQAVALFV